MLEGADISKVEATLGTFADGNSDASRMFYDRLFELAPDLRPMFPGDMADQSRKLSATLTVAIESLRDWESLAPILAALARRHIGYGAEPWHYAVVTRALLDTLRTVGVAPESVAAWNRTMSAISSHMIASAYGEARRARSVQI